MCPKGSGKYLQKEVKKQCCRYARNKRNL